MMILGSSAFMNSSVKIIHMESGECCVFPRRPLLIDSIPERNTVIEIAKKKSDPLKNASALGRQFSRNMSGFILPILFYR